MAFMEKKAKAILASSKQQGQPKFLSEEDLERIDADFIKSHQQVLLDLLDLDAITDQNLKDILDMVKSDGSDAARRQVLFLYSCETPLFGAVNRANQTQDESAVPTLGAYGALLYRTVWEPP